MWWYHMGPWEVGWPGPWMMLGPTILLLFGIAAIVVALAIRGAGSRSEPAAAPRQAAMAILQDRFVRGEIDVEEYLERRRVLEEDQGTAEA